MRAKYSQWYVSEKEYAPSVFPPFALGSIYLITRAAARDLYKKAMEIAFFKLEDVFMTGIVAELANVTRISAHDFLSLGIKNVCELKTQISKTYVSYTQQYDYWDALMGSHLKC